MSHVNDTAGWYEFRPENDNGPSVIGMADWLEAPAGQHGGVRMVADRSAAGGRFDYLHAALQQRGIYVGWSFVFHQKLRPVDRDRLLAYDEIMQNRNGEIITLVNYAEDLQDLRMDMELNLLGHRNEHTGLTYAEDPALAFVELQNEDDVFFSTGAEAVPHLLEPLRRAVLRLAGRAVRLPQGPGGRLGRTGP